MKTKLYPISSSNDANLHTSAEEINQGIIGALIYFDIFNYPLTLQEIIQYSAVKITEINQVTTIINHLVDRLIIFNFDHFYTLKNDSSLAERRKRGNAMATSIMPRAKKQSKFIHKFPFVRSVNISGSLSKNYFDESTDIDFFIITAPNRIWICRMLLTLYKKIGLLNSRKYFCINYFIDTEDLLIPDKNLFSATEIITLKNYTGRNEFKSFIQCNDWVREYFPNFTPTYQFLDKGKKKLLLKGRLEKILQGPFGNWLDNCCFKLTLYFWKRKFPHLSNVEFSVNLRSKKHVSKHHPQGFQFKVLDAYQQKCKEFEHLHNMFIPYA